MSENNSGLAEAFTGINKAHSTQDLEGRVERLERGLGQTRKATSDLEAAINNLSNATAQKFTGLEQAMANLAQSATQRFGGLDQAIAALTSNSNAKFSSIEQAVAGIASGGAARFSALEQAVTEMRGFAPKFAELENKVNGHAAFVASLGENGPMLVEDGDVAAQMLAKMKGVDKLGMFQMAAFKGKRSLSGGKGALAVGLIGAAVAGGVAAHKYKKKNGHYPLMKAKAVPTVN